MESELVEDWKDILGLVSWVLKATMDSSELYLITLGLAQIHMVLEGATSFLPPTVFCPNELSFPNEISGEGGLDEFSGGRGSVVDCSSSVVDCSSSVADCSSSVVDCSSSVMDCSIEPGRVLALVLSVFLFMSDINQCF